MTESMLKNDPTLLDAGNEFAALLDIDWERLSGATNLSAQSVGSAPKSTNLATHLPGPAQWSLNPLTSPLHGDSGYHSQNLPWTLPSIPPTPAVLISPESAEFLKTAISADLQVKLSMQFSIIQQALAAEVKEMIRQAVTEMKEEFRLTRRRAKKQ